MLTEIDAAPSAIVTRRRPTTFVDVVHRGSTFTELYGIVRDWVVEEHVDRNAARRKLRFVGVTSREQTSPNTFRWQQHAPWTSELPARGVLNVSVHRDTWSYLADQQTKLTRTFPPHRWTVDPEVEPEPRPTAPPAKKAGRPAAETLEERRQRLRRDALAEAVALVEAGRSAAVRQALSRVAGGEPTVAEPWLRDLVTRLARPH
ncbi:MAG: hypothetical protein HY830_16785 [Actinobacteria bacterium]|nr:hypothetical protein [Actinomycetota bacterium]